MSEQTDKQKEWDEKKIGAIWIKTSSKGKEYLTGKINDQPFIAFKSVNKFNDNSPDYTIYKSEPKPAQNSEKKPEKRVSRPNVAARPAPKPAPREETEADDGGMF